VRGLGPSLQLLGQRSAGVGEASSRATSWVTSTRGTCCAKQARPGALAESTWIARRTARPMRPRLDREWRRQANSNRPVVAQKRRPARTHAEGHSKDRCNAWRPFRRGKDRVGGQEGDPSDRSRRSFRPSSNESATASPSTSKPPVRNAIRPATAPVCRSSYRPDGLRDQRPSR